MESCDVCVLKRDTPSVYVCRRALPGPGHLAERSALSVHVNNPAAHMRSQ